MLNGRLTSIAFCKFIGNFVLNEKICFQFQGALNLSYYIYKLFVVFYTSIISSESLKVTPMGTPPIPLKMLHHNKDS